MGGRGTWLTDEKTALSSMLEGVLRCHGVSRGTEMGEVLSGSAEEGRPGALSHASPALGGLKVVSLGTPELLFLIVPYLLIGPWPSPSAFPPLTWLTSKMTIFPLEVLLKLIKHYKWLLLFST